MQAVCIRVDQASIEKIRYVLIVKRRGDPNGNTQPSLRRKDLAAHKTRLAAPRSPTFRAQDAGSSIWLDRDGPLS